VVQYALPAFRSLVAKELIKKYYFSQTIAAEKLGITQAAISQYVCSKRGAKEVRRFESVPQIRLAATEVAKGLAEGSLSTMDTLLVFCRLCIDLRDHDVICHMHQSSISLPELCNVCQTAT